MVVKGERIYLADIRVEEIIESLSSIPPIHIVTTYKKVVTD